MSLFERKHLIYYLFGIIGRRAKEARAWNAKEKRKDWKVESRAQKERIRSDKKRS